MVYQPSREKSWHRYNVSNGTPKLVAPTIDASVRNNPADHVRKT